MDASRPREKVHWWRPDSLPGVEVLEAENCGHLWKVYHETYAICQVWDKPGVWSKWRYRGKRQETRAGGFMMMEPGETHVTEELGAPGDFWVLQFDPGLFAEFERRDIIRRPPHLADVNPECPHFFSAMRKLHFALKNPVPRLEKEIRLAEVQRLFLERFCENKPTPQPEADHRAVKAAKDYMHAHFTDDISLAELAQAAYICPHQLDRLFQRCVGMSPTKYQNGLRVEAAKRELAHGVPPGHIQVGFSDASYLARVFRERTRVTPSNYRLGKPRIGLSAPGRAEG